MKEERMYVLKMLEAGKINSQEAERLLKVLTEKKDSVTKEEVSNAISAAFSKTTAAIDSLAKKVGTKAKDVSPVIKRAKDDLSKKAGDFVTEIKNKKKDDDEDEFFDDDFWADELEEDDDDETFEFSTTSEISDDDFVKDVEIIPFKDSEPAPTEEYKSPIIIGLSEDEMVDDPFNRPEGQTKKEEKKDTSEYKAPIYIELSDDEKVIDPFNQ